MAGHERVHQAAVMPFSWVGAGQQPQQSWLAECPYAGYSGMALPPPLHNALQHSFTFAPSHHAATSFVPPPRNYKQFAPPPHHARTSFVPPDKPAPASAPAPPVKKATPNPYVAFCREQRPFLPTALRNAEREQVLGMRWKMLSSTSRAAYQQGSLPAPAPVPASALLFGYHSANRLHSKSLPPAPPAPATVFWFGYHSSPEVIRRAPMPTAAVAVPMRTSAPDLAAPAPSMAPSTLVATTPAPPPELLFKRRVALKLAPPAPPTPSAPPTPTAPPAASATPTPFESSGLERLSTVATVAFKRLAALEELVATNSP